MLSGALYDTVLNISLQLEADTNAYVMTLTIVGNFGGNLKTVRSRTRQSYIAMHQMDEFSLSDFQYFLHSTAEFY